MSDVMNDDVPSLDGRFDVDDDGAFPSPNDNEIFDVFASDDTSGVDNASHVLPAEEYKKLIAQTNVNDKLADALSGMNATQQQSLLLQQAQYNNTQIANQRASQIELDEDALERELETELITDGKGGKAVLKGAKAIVAKERKVFESVISDLQSQIAEIQFATAAQTDVERIVVSQHGDEVKEILRQMQPSLRKNPENIKLAMQVVAGKHFETISKELYHVSETMRKDVNGGTEPANYTSRNGMVGGVAPQQRQQVKLNLTTQQINDGATQAGLTPTEYRQRMARLQIWRAKNGKQ